MSKCEVSAEQLTRLTDLSLAMGVCKKKSKEELVPIKVAFFPYSMNQEAYTNLQSVSEIWQKLLFKVSRNDELIYKVFEQIKDTDPMISNLMRIKRLKAASDDDGLTFARTDYFISEIGEPKIIEYNLFSVSMTSHSENFQEAKKLSDFNNKHKYIHNKPNSTLALEIHQLYLRRNLKGSLIMLVAPTEVNVIQQRILQIKLLQAGIKIIKMSLSEASNLKVDQLNNLRNNNDLVSIVYFRTGYQPKDYSQNPKLLWLARQKIELSNAIKIPNITYDLLNQKRMQVELSKQQVYSQYLSEQEIALFKKSLVPVYEFDHITEEQFHKFIGIIEKEGKEYVLKPNMEGGGNNIYGKDAISVLKSLNVEQRKQYILMQKIVTKPVQNLLLNGENHVEAKCICEISQYGVILVENNELLKSETCGFLLRIKPENENEGGIMAGIGSICSMVIQ